MDTMYNFGSLDVASPENLSVPFGQVTVNFFASKESLYRIGPEIVIFSPQPFLAALTSPLVRSFAWGIHLEIRGASFLELRDHPNGFCRMHPIASPNRACAI